jgi:hypothetical protein
MSNVKERPILFSAPMVRAILEGRKTQTRRVEKEFAGRDDLDAILKRYPNQNGCPYGAPGDRLWVRETMRVAYEEGDAYDPMGGQGASLGSFHGVSYGLARHPPTPYLVYAADKSAFDKLPPDGKADLEIKSIPSIHMPRWASRIDLEVTGVRVERLQDISEADAIAEGVRDGAGLYGDDDIGLLNAVLKTNGSYPVGRFAMLWQSINGAGSWDANPFVWVVEFKRVRP